MTRKRRRETVDPKKFRKHSDVVTQSSRQTLIAGKRNETKTGYITPGTSCKNYETFHQYIGPNQVTDRLRHPKKYRSLRVLSGQGVVRLYKEDSEKTVLVLPGEEFTLSPGIDYEIATAAKIPLELLVTQAYKYEASLEVVKESETGIAPTVNLDEIKREDALKANLNSPATPRRRSGGPSKAARQQSQIAAAKGRAPVVPQNATIVTENINASPSMGRD